MSTQRISLFELRSYAAQPGKRAVLIDMFERIFLDAYQASGARIIGTFRSLDDPDRWVWIRAFADARSRGLALERFYEGEVWKRNAAACNALIASVVKAILLRAVRPEEFDGLCVPPAGTAVPDTLYELAISPTEEGQVTFVTDRSENFYPRQPVRSDTVFITLKRCASITAQLAPTGRSALR